MRALKATVRVLAEPYRVPPKLKRNRWYRFTELCTSEQHKKSEKYSFIGTVLMDYGRFYLVRSKGGWDTTVSKQDLLCNWSVEEL